MLKVKDLVLQFGSHTKPLNFEVKPGTTLWLRGENGAGKSTLLLTIAGIIKAKSGSVESPHSAFSHAPQKPSFTFGLGTKRVLELAGIDSTSPLITKLGIDSFLNTPVSELSGGEAQRVQIAIALGQKSNYVILDEPFASQDLESIERIKKLIEEAKTEGKTFIVASHIALDANQVIDLN
jgi:ABC-type Mn2+/Zn2+ transport system ATPase subunit